MSRAIRQGGGYMSKKDWLPNDVARCNGVGSDDPEEGWREGCETCLRRLAPRPDRCVMMGPPPILVFACEYLIEGPPGGGREKLAERSVID